MKMVRVTRMALIKPSSVNISISNKANGSRKAHLPFCGEELSLRQTSVVSSFENHYHTLCGAKKATVVLCQTQP